MFLALLEVKSYTLIMIKTIYMVSLLTVASCAQQLPDFTSRLSARMPVEASSEAIGEYSLGCLLGAQTFSGEENGLVLSQTKRGRYWAHPDLINILTKAGEYFFKTDKKLIIGDLSQSRGGPTLTGHNSHQTGLDVDIWFRILTAKEKISFKDLETLDMNSFKELGDDQVRLIKFFASDSSVDRIFINPLFKKKLCEKPGKLSTEEHHKLRAWWGHDDHIHVRLKCPAGNKDCISQKFIPAGDGCGEDLNWWFTDEALAGDVDIAYEDLKKVYLNKVKKLPERCSLYKEIF